ncbi:hypothetical protein NF867_08335 [Solitalea sp. MAHUQ-68]|uniref:Uncharacterized protein n=1 Tax=Solitalea agri TaxID=2953739 RepID=A0A9X2F2D7_9SPHI|nr:hypothetical protein [Solitalea agri]MCO4292865.1 hypothetical protein [Solitalea agri]
MKKLLIFLFYLFTINNVFSQNDISQATSAILKEGKLLYQSEMASWYGTDIFREKLKDKAPKVGGYFSYGENEGAKCIFFSNDEIPKVIGSVSFDSTYNVNTARVDATERVFSPKEMSLYQIRKKALATIKSDTLFKHYNNTNLNLIPLIENNQKKVYVLTGPSVSGVVVFGNDYLLTYDNDHALVSVKRLHKNIIPINYEDKQEQNGIITMHSHLPETGDFITATDICTLMLYEKFAKWKQHIVMSKNYVSLWDCNKDILAILTREAWERIGKNEKGAN